MSFDRAVQPSDPPAQVEGSAFREAMSRWASGVTVVTAPGRTSRSA